MAEVCDTHHTRSFYYFPSLRAFSSFSVSQNSSYLLRVITTADLLLNQCPAPHKFKT
jgi:hypothetical protein